MVQYQDPMKDKPILESGQNRSLQVAGAVMGAIAAPFVAIYVMGPDAMKPLVMLAFVVGGAVSGFVASTANG